MIRVLAFDSVYTAPPSPQSRLEVSLVNRDNEFEMLTLKPTSRIRMSLNESQTWMVGNV